MKGLAMNAFGKCGGGGRRCAARQAGPLTAIISTVTESRSAVLLDVSTTGARLEGDDLPHVGDELLVAVETIRAFGVIRWSQCGQVGVAFDDPLDGDEVRALRAKVFAGRGFMPGVKAAMDDWNTGFAR